MYWKLKFQRKKSIFLLLLCFCFCSWLSVSLAKDHYSVMVGTLFKLGKAYLFSNMRISRIVTVLNSRASTEMLQLKQLNARIANSPRNIIQIGIQIHLQLISLLRLTMVCVSLSLLITYRSFNPQLCSQLLLAAYEVLGDEKKRAEYDTFGSTQTGGPSGRPDPSFTHASKGGTSSGFQFRPSEDIFSK